MNPELINDLKFSDIDLAFVKDYLHVERDFVEDDIQISAFMSMAKSFVIEHSAMTVEQLDASNHLNVVYLKMILDLYQKRSATGGGAFEPIFAMVLANSRNRNL